jgi:hypothetical protein
MTDPICQWCDEPLLPDDERAPGLTPPAHWECGLRSVTGGLNHLRGLCSCCGGTEDPDPQGMTRREAAQAAAKEWLLRHG